MANRGDDGRRSRRERQAAAPEAGRSRGGARRAQGAGQGGRAAGLQGAGQGGRAAGPKKAPVPGPYDAIKEEAARELGLWERVQRAGWGELSAAETGRVGAYITRVLRLRGQAAGAGPADGK